MSAEFYATPVYGICITEDMIRIKRANPAYNADTPFDPKTGKRIDEHLTECLDIEEIATEHGMSMCESTDSKYVFIGIVGKDIDVGCEHFSKLPKFDKCAIDAKLEYICHKHGFYVENIGYYAVGYCSY